MGYVEITEYKGIMGANPITVTAPTNTATEATGTDHYHVYFHRFIAQSRDLPHVDKIRRHQDWNLHKVLQAIPSYLLKIT